MSCMNCNEGDECFNPIVRVDQARQIKYPDGTVPLYPNLELAGPDSFDIRKLVQCSIHSSGEEAYKELIARSLIKNCLGLTEFLAILSRGGPGLFLKHYGDQKTIYGFRSIVKCADTDVLMAPHLSYDPEVDGGDVIVGWERLDWMTVSGESLILLFHSS